MAQFAHGAVPPPGAAFEPPTGTGRAGVSTAMTRQGAAGELHGTGSGAAARCRDVNALRVARASGRAHGRAGGGAAGAGAGADDVVDETMAGGAEMTLKQGETAGCPTQ